MNSERLFLKYVGRVQSLISLLFLMSVILFVILILWVNGLFNPISKQPESPIKSLPQKVQWHAPDISVVKDEKERKAIAYGKELIAHTSKYFGPQGSINQTSNGLNCQNCHLDAGTKPFGNNYATVAASYPKYRARSGKIESVEKRVNDCFERSLNGKPLDTASIEMQAIVSYIRFVGTGVELNRLPEGTGMKKITLVYRAADPAKGKQLYETQCTTCHGKNGEGMKQADAAEYQFPPLWGPQSYNTGAGLYRLSNFAQFVYSNMPLGATSDHPVLTEEQAWDIAAFVNSMPRPKKDLSKDWPKIETKPFDHPFGPYADPYPEAQHKFGPFKEIQMFYSQKNK